MANLKINHITSYKELDEWVGEKETKQVGYHTVARRGGYHTVNHPISDHIIIRQWNTDIYTLFPDNIATLRVDGWYTVATKQRLNDLLPMNLSIYSEKGRWFVRKRQAFVYTDGIQAFADGIQINVETSEVVANPNLSDWQKEDVENARLKRKIAAYVKDLTDEKVRELYDDARTNGMNGDCLYCLMQAGTKGSLGDATGDTEHLLHHIEEKYYMASLNLNALHAAKRGSPEFCLSMGFAVRQDVGKYLRKRLLKGIAVA